MLNSRNQEENKPKSPIDIILNDIQEVRSAIRSFYTMQSDGKVSAPHITKEIMDEQIKMKVDLNNLKEKLEHVKELADDDRYGDAIKYLNDIKFNYHKHGKDWYQDKGPIIRHDRIHIYHLSEELKDVIKRTKEEYKKLQKDQPKMSGKSFMQKSAQVAPGDLNESLLGKEPKSFRNKF